MLVSSLNPGIAPSGLGGVCGILIQPRVCTPVATTCRPFGTGEFAGNTRGYSTFCRPFGTGEFAGNTQGKYVLSSFETDEFTGDAEGKRIAPMDRPILVSPLRGWGVCGILFHRLTPVATFCRPFGTGEFAGNTQGKYVLSSLRDWGLCGIWFHRLTPVAKFCRPFGADNSPANSSEW